MTSENVYKLYLAIKLHFTTDSYDYFKYNGVVRFNRETFAKRNDKFFFAKLGKKLDEKECIKFFVANFLKKQKLWVGDLSEEYYSEWQKSIESLEYNFKKDLSTIQHEMDTKSLTYDDLFTSSNGYPLIISLFNWKKISTETFLIFDNLFQLIDYFDVYLKDDFVWLDKSTQLKKYRSFFNKLVFDNEDSNKYIRLIKENLIS